MAEITINIKGQFVTKSSKNAGSAGSANSTDINIIFDEEWNGFAKRIVWHNSEGGNETSILLVPEIADSPDHYKTHIPPEATDTEGWCSFTVEGYYENNPGVVQKSVTDKLFVSYSRTKEYANLSPDEAMQLHAEFEQLMPKVNEKIRKTEENIEELSLNMNLWEMYDVSTVYKKGNKVSYDGRCYVCISDAQGVNPENESFWMMISDRGEKGERGLQGLKGERGDKGDRGEKGDKGEKGDRGEQGINGIVVPTDGFYSFDVDENGDLWVHYPDENNPPDISLNKNGELIISTGNNRYNAGNVKGPMPKKGVDYFTAEDIRKLKIPVVDDRLDSDSENALKNKIAAMHINTLYTEASNNMDGINVIKNKIKELIQFFAVSKTLFGGRCLGTTITPKQIEAVRNGTFVYTNKEGQTDMLMLGDYWSIGGYDWRIVDFDYWLNTGENRATLTTKHHLVLMPDTTVVTRSIHNEESECSTGYYNSVGRTVLRTIMNNVFESNFPADIVNVLSHRECFCSFVGYSSGLPGKSEWADSTFELPSEQMMFGTRIVGPGNNGNTVATFNTVSKTQLALFRIAPQFINIGIDYWLRDNITYSRNAVININGAVSSGQCVGACAWRPVFAIC